MVPRLTVLQVHCEAPLVVESSHRLCVAVSFDGMIGLERAFGIGFDFHRGFKLEAVVNPSHTFSHSA